MTGELAVLGNQVLSGLAFLHERGIIHFNLKAFFPRLCPSLCMLLIDTSFLQPSNIFKTMEGSWVIGDYCETQILCRPYFSKQRPPCSVLSSLWYRAPELIIHPSILTAAADMWRHVLSAAPVFPC